MQLPDESISFDPQRLLAPAVEDWTAAAELRARHLVSPARFRELHQGLLQCRGQVAADREMQNPPAEYLPLDPGFINLPQELLDSYRRKQDASELGKVLALAGRLKEQSDRVVVLGVGGSSLGARALFGALRSGYHNELPPETRLGVPRVYFAGDSADTDALQELLDLLQITCVDPEQRDERWSVVCVSKSGANIEPGVALRAFRREASEYYGLRSPYLKQLFAAVSGPSGKLRSLFEAVGVTPDGILNIPENVGGRYSVFTPAGLLPASIMGLDVRALLLGAAAMTRRFLEEPIERNPVLQFAGLNHLLHVESDKPIRVLSVWSNKLAGVGAWYEHLLSESLGKQGADRRRSRPCRRATRHTRGQQHQDGPRDRVIINLVVRTPHTVPIGVQMADHNEDDLNRFNRRTLPDIVNAALKATNQSYYEVARPTSDIVLPVVSEHTMGQLLQMLMLATVVEGRLMGVNPYSQPGAESYRRNVAENLKAVPETATSAQGAGGRPRPE